MYKDTIYQIILLFVTTFVFFQTGKYTIGISDINTMKDFGIVMVFFISLVFFLNYFLRLSGKVYKFFGK